MAMCLVHNADSRFEVSRRGSPNDLFKQDLLIARRIRCQFVSLAILVNNCASRVWTLFRILDSAGIVNYPIC